MSTVAPKASEFPFSYFVPTENVILLESMCRVIRAWNGAYPQSEISINIQIVGLTSPCFMSLLGALPMEDLIVSSQLFTGIPGASTSSSNVPHTKAEVMAQICAMVGAYNFKFQTSPIVVPPLFFSSMRQ